ncbi:MAG: SIMPL domain-containing protein [Candidatus Magasanikbacteria bacterium]|nr:SIMPL domain-containing protein [Candidatus Magasanikbacteria bacterium]
MPVIKSKPNGNGGEGVHPCATCGGDFGKKIILTLVGITLLYLVVFLGTLIRNNMQKYYFIGKADKGEHLVTLDGDGKVTVVPDVGVVSMGAITKKGTVAEAQQTANDRIKVLTDKLVALGIAKADIKTTNYTIYPKITYDQKGKEQVDGYEVNQGVTIKIRDVSKANDVLALAGQVEANNVNGLQFVVDDPEIYRAQARAKALEVVERKAKVLAQTLGVRLVSIVSYNEYPLSDNGPVYDMGMSTSGGSVSSGSNEIGVRVNVTFEIR